MHKQGSGLTLIELIIAMAITGILATVVVPPFLNSMATHRLEWAIETTLSALQNTKAEAINKNMPMRLIFMPETADTKHSTWCFGITETATCDCNTDASCKTGSVVKSTDFPDISVQFNRNHIQSFSALKGTTNTSTITFLTSSHSQKIIISSQGRIRTESIESIDGN